MSDRADGVAVAGHAASSKDLAEKPTFSYHVLNVDCPSCAMGCQNAVRNLECVEDAKLTYATATLDVVKKPEAELGHCRRHVLATVRSCGQDLDLADDERADLEARRPWVIEHREQVLMGLSGAFLAVGLVAEHLVGVGSAAATAFVIGALCGLAYIVPLAWASLRRKTADMNVLMTIAVVGALAMGAFEEAAVVIFLNQVGEWLEGWSMRKTTGSIKELMNLTPPVAHVLAADGSVSDVEVAEVEEGSSIRILPGERVPLDGVISRGSSSFDEAPVTGESVPQDKGVGAEVFGGTLNTSSPVEVEVTADEDCSTLARIVSMVQGAQAEKAPYEAFIDRFAEIYTPVVVGIAIAIALVVPLVVGATTGFDHLVWRDWVYRALTLLVIACPCALVISTPVSFVSAITRAARNGVLVKGGAYFDIASKVTAVTFDKTGTLTSGNPSVTGIACFNGASEQGILAPAAALESDSTHPLAKAIVARASERGVEHLSAEGVTEVTGNGMTGSVGGTSCAVGKLAFARTLAEVPAEAEQAACVMASSGATALFVVAAGAVVGVIGVADTVRDSSKAVVSDLLAQGISQLVMLTGDNAQTARAVGGKVGVTDVAAELLPDGKVERIKAIQLAGSKVAMVGDGINDAPALAAADLGVTMGAAASDTALEVADVALLSGDLAQLPGFFRLSRRTMNVVRENVAFAIAVKVIVMVLAIMGMAGMGAAVFADTGVALIVILNGMRLMTKAETRW